MWTRRQRAVVLLVVLLLLTRSSNVVFLTPSAFSLHLSSITAATTTTATTPSKFVSFITDTISLVLRFVKDQFDDYRESTIGGKTIRLLAILSMPFFFVVVFLSQREKGGNK